MIRFRFTLIALFFTSFLFAQDFEVSPVLLNFNADPGEIQKREVALINHSSHPQKYTLKVTDFLMEKDGTKKMVPHGVNKRSCTDWITINPSYVELNPNQTAKFEVLMAVPKDGFSARWCLIHVEAAREQSAFDADKNLATGVLVKPRIVIQVKQSPKSNNNYKATIANLKETTKAGDKQRNFEVTVTNTGDNIIDANISLALANMQTASEQKYPGTKGTVYPESSRTFKLQIPKELPNGKYALAAILDYGHRQPMAGTQLIVEYK